MISRSWFLPTSEINPVKRVHRVNQSDLTILQITPGVKVHTFLPSAVGAL
jgi:hypothetical protein